MASIKKTVFSLSGGGAKGSFQLGAIEYAYSRGLQPDSLISTSVGSVNAVKLAEGEHSDMDGYLSGLRGLSAIWRNQLITATDMYVESDALKRLKVSLDLPEAAGPAAFSALAGGAPGLVVSGAVWAGMVLVKAVDAAADLIGAFSLYTLRPLEQRFHATGPSRSLDMALLQNSPIELFLTSVALVSGATYYVDKSGTVFLLNGAPEPISTGQSLLDAMLASAAIPLAFEPRKVNGEYCVDGGVIEIIPFDFAASLRPSRLVAISCSAPTRRWSIENWFEESSDWAPLDLDALPATYGGGGILNTIRFFGMQMFPGLVSGGNPSFQDRLGKIGFRGLDLALNEIARNDTAGMASTQAHAWIIRPEIDIHDTLTVETGLIGISADYGWMCAHDAIDSSVRSNERRRFLTSLATRISETRRRAWINELMMIAREDALAIEVSTTHGGATASTLENLFLTAVLEDPTVQSHLAKTQELKGLLRDLCETRRRVAGEDSMPPGNEQWWLDYERHSPAGLPLFNINQVAGVRKPLPMLGLPVQDIAIGEDPKLRLEWVGRASGWALQAGAGSDFELFLLQPFDLGVRLARFTQGTDHDSWAMRREIFTNQARQTGVDGRDSGIGGSIAGFSAFAHNFDVPAKFEIYCSLWSPGHSGLYQIYSDERGDFSGPFPVKVGNDPVVDVSGTPEVIQGDGGRQGNYELVVPMFERGRHSLAHFVRDNDAGMVWRKKKDVFVVEPVSAEQGLGAMVPAENCLFLSPDRVLLLATRMVSPLPGFPAQVVVSSLDPASDVWSKTTVRSGKKTVINAAGRPAAIVAAYGTKTVMELVVAISDNSGTRLEHYRCSDLSAKDWVLHATVLRITPLRNESPPKLGDCWMFQSDRGIPGNLQLFVRQTPGIASNGAKILHFEFDAHAQSWGKPVVVASGSGAIVVR